MTLMTFNDNRIQIQSMHITFYNKKKTKKVHRECETIKNSGYSTSELRRDIEEMEKEKEFIFC